MCALSQLGVMVDSAMYPFLEKGRMVLCCSLFQCQIRLLVICLNSHSMYFELNVK